MPATKRGHPPHRHLASATYPSTQFGACSRNFPPLAILCVTPSHGFRGSPTLHPKKRRRCGPPQKEAASAMQVPSYLRRRFQPMREHELNQVWKESQLPAHMDFPVTRARSPRHRLSFGPPSFLLPLRAESDETLCCVPANGALSGPYVRQLTCRFIAADSQPSICQSHITRSSALGGFPFNTQVCATISDRHEPTCTPVPTLPFR